MALVAAQVGGLLLCLLAAPSVAAATSIDVAPAGLAVSWRYHAGDGEGRLRLYRGPDWGHLEPLLEVPVEAGRHEDRVETGTAALAPAVFQLRFVSPAGVEVVLGTVTWLPPHLVPAPAAAAAGSPSALIPASAVDLGAVGAPRRRCDHLPPGRALAGHGEPLVPPPERARTWMGLRSSFV